MSWQKFERGRVIFFCPQRLHDFFFSQEVCSLNLHDSFLSWGFAWRLCPERLQYIFCPERLRDFFVPTGCVIFYCPERLHDFFDPEKLRNFMVPRGCIICLSREVQFSPTPPSGPSWSSSHRVCWFDVPFPCNFFRGLSLALRLALSSWPPRQARPSAISWWKHV